MTQFWGSFHLARILGITVKVHITLVIFLAFLLFGTERFSGSGSLAVGAAILAGYFLSVLLHEFGHSLACKAVNGRSDEILMGPLGGLAYCRPPHHPTAHLITTVCGPLVTLVIWLLLTQVVAGMLPQNSLAYHLVVGLGFWNYVLLLFNLLPGFPMDGGRIVRDVLWHFIGFARSTRIAVWTGRVTGALMVLASLGMVQNVPIISKFEESWMMGFIGVFVLISNWNMNRVLAMEGAAFGGFTSDDYWKRPKKFSAPWKNLLPSKRRKGYRSSRKALSVVKKGAKPKRRYDPKLKPTARPPSSSAPAKSIDHLLEKIARDGMASLTDEERAQLAAASNDLANKDKDK